MMNEREINLIINEYKNEVIALKKQFKTVALSNIESDIKEREIHKLDKEYFGYEFAIKTLEKILEC